MRICTYSGRSVDKRSGLSNRNSKKNLNNFSSIRFRSFFSQLPRIKNVEINWFKIRILNDQY